MLELNNITKSFGKPNQTGLKVLNQINLTVHSGDFVVVVGANGSGKSTLLNIIAGTVLPDNGTIALAGKCISRIEQYRRSAWIARVFQNPLQGTAVGLTVLENFRMAALRSKKKTFKIGVNDVFRRRVAERLQSLGMGLENKLDTPIEALSGGQRQALTIMMSVMDDLKLLLLDEPTAALDPKSAHTVLQLSKQLIEENKLTAIMITHNMREALDYGNRILHLHSGQIKQDLPLEQKKKLSIGEVHRWFELD